ncbi:MAG: modification methylase [Parcubacteria group bacterium CG11_big_fil_rev_8_21_14_0_20_39_14]|nr:MAG: modification methylase [Parcubacteria group bacterium CG11_big_fil_rev_8_21_14_0_20_39_14]PIS35652.1 MAG: modification methylase [Parcubacteria group bacterium CG08_land_8_20_14_0_20_38_56]
MKNEVYKNNLENEYSESSSLEHRRLLGQFFTPYQVAKFMAEWILLHPKKQMTILDPATGFGIFERALTELKRKKKLSFDLWEIDNNIANKLKLVARELNLDSCLVQEDFLKNGWNKKFDGIIANPPYFKHHFINQKERVYQEVCLRAYFKFSLQTNVYCWFLIKSINLLADGGRLAFIVPSEFLNANYGEKIKDYLKQIGIVLHLINIDFNENVFDNALTTSVIILAEKGNKKHNHINFYSVHNLAELKSLKTFLEKHPKKTYKITELDSKTKWRNYFNGNGEKKLPPSVVPVSVFGRFSRGIATGANDYFALSKLEITEYKLPTKHLVPCITKATHAKDISFDAEEFEKLRENNKKVYLFNGEGANDSYGSRYIDEGKHRGVHLRYLTRNRNPWYALEKRPVAPIWVNVFGRNGLKFIWNTSHCVNLTCFHAFSPSDIGKNYLSIFFLYLHSKIAKELFDREKREYGNGLEKFEPNDLNKTMMIDFRLLENQDKSILSELQRDFLQSRKERRPVVLEKADKIFRKYTKATF